jgi:hypothetical protein
MKKIMKAKSILVGAIALISSVAFAKGSDTGKLVVLSQNESGIFKVIYEGDEKVNVRMNIVDKDGNLILTKSIKAQGGFIQPVNFSGMQFGEYTIEVVNGSSTLAKSVMYTKPVAEPEVSSIQQVYLSKLSEEGKYLLSVVRTGSEQVSITIEDANGNVVYSERHKAEGDFARLYKVKEVEGNPTFTVSNKAGYIVSVKK